MPGMFGGMGNSPMQQMEIVPATRLAATAQQQQQERRRRKKKKGFGTL